MLFQNELIEVQFIISLCLHLLILLSRPIFLELLRLFLLFSVLRTSFFWRFSLLAIFVLLLFFQELAHLLTFFDRHFLRPSSDVVPVWTHTGIDKTNQIHFSHSVALLPQELKQIHDVVSPGLLENESFDLFLSFGHLLLKFKHYLRITTSFDFFEFLTETLHLLVQLFYNLRFDDPLIGSLGSRFFDEVVEVRPWHFVSFVSY